MLRLARYDFSDGKAKGPEVLTKTFSRKCVFIRKNCFCFCFETREDELLRNEDTVGGKSIAKDLVLIPREIMVIWALVRRAVITLIPQQLEHHEHTMHS